MGCEGCEQEAKQKNKALNDCIISAKQKASEEGKAKAVCYDEVQGFFIADAITAYQEHYQIRDIISNM